MTLMQQYIGLTKYQYEYIWKYKKCIKVAHKLEAKSKEEQQV